MKLIEWKIDPRIEAYTTTRLDGVSQGTLDSLNLSFNVNDLKENVLTNRLKLASYLHTDLNHMVASRQKHTTNFIKVSKEDGGKGMYQIEDAIDNYDAMYTRDKNLFLLSFHADCTPVLLFAEDEMLIAEIHSGWKGNVNEITNKIVKHLIKHENCSPKHLFAYIGPSINFENFEVGQEVIDLVNQMSFDGSDCYSVKENGKYLFDGKKLVLKQLLINNVPLENITISPYCTIKNNDLFYSYRKNHHCGRNVTMIKIKE